MGLFNQILLKSFCILDQKAYFALQFMNNNNIRIDYFHQEIKKIYDVIFIFEKNRYQNTKQQRKRYYTQIATSLQCITK